MGRSAGDSRLYDPRRETFEELLTNLYEAVEGCLSVDLSDIPISATDRLLEIAV